jgi:hypothetical protein
MMVRKILQKYQKSLQAMAIALTTGFKFFSRVTPPYEKKMSQSDLSN